MAPKPRTSGKDQEERHDYGHIEMSSLAGGSSSRRRNTDVTHSKAPAAGGKTHTKGATSSTQNEDKLAEGSAGKYQSSQKKKNPVPCHKPYYGLIGDAEDEDKEENLDLVQLDPAQLPQKLEDLLKADELKEQKEKEEQKKKEEQERRNSRLDCDLSSLTSLFAKESIHKR